MPKTFVISDTHLHHENILNFTDGKTGERIRPQFSVVDEMDEFILDSWNSVVKPGDKVYHLGDVFLNNPDKFKKFWPKFNGKKTLIVGNHDDIKFLCSGGFFSNVHMWRKLPEYGVILSHVPLHVSTLFNKHTGGTYTNIHGHIHQNPSPEGPYINVSVEAISYVPIEIA